MALIACRSLKDLRRMLTLFPPGGHLLRPTCRLLHGLPPSQDFVAVAEYPPIPPSDKKFDVEEQKLVKMVKELKTVEEKLYYLNKPKYYGWYSAIIDPERIFYGSLDFAQYVTWTHAVEGLPPAYNTLDDEVDRLCEKIVPRLERLLLRDESLVEDAIDVPNDKAPLHEAKSKPPVIPLKTTSRQEVQDRVANIDRIIRMSMGLPHLLQAQVDYDFRSEAFWFRGGFNPDKSMVKKRLGTQKYFKKHPYKRAKTGPFTDEEVYQRHDLPIQIEGSSLLQLRSPKMISPFVSFENPLCHQHDAIPKFHHDPRSLSYSTRCQNGTNTPGFWTCSRNSFTSLQYVSNLNTADNLSSSSNRTDDFNERQDMLLVKSIFSAFGLLLPEACHLGFTPLNDPEHPLTTQTCVTDGLKWKLSVFQLNKTALHRDSDQSWSNNVIWHNPEFDLLTINEATGQKEVSRSGLRDIVKFYLMQPSEEVPRQVKFVHEIKDTYHREAFHNLFRYMYTKRSRHFLKPEILAYQKLYMIDHDLWFAHGLRERPWFKMAKIDFKGKEHWHPEFKQYDHYEPAYQPKVYRSNPWERKVKKVVPPIEVE